MHDFGGPFGLAWAIRNPGRVGRIVATNTVLSQEYRWHAWARVWRTPILGELSMALMNRPMFAQQLRRGSPTLSDAFIRETYELITPRMKRMVLKLYRATNPENYVPWEGGLHALAAKTPICVLWGDRDPYIAPHFADRLGAREVHHFPEYGHFLPVEAPDDVAAHVRAFLT